jgi:hypothetical protein
MSVRVIDKPLCLEYGVIRKFMRFVFKGGLELIE